MASKATKERRIKKKEVESAKETAEEINETNKKDSSKAKKAQRASSNIYAMFDHNEIQEFKEAFQMIDSNKDGIIDKHDLRVTFESLGKISLDEDLQAMLEEASGPINFATFLAIFGQKIVGGDPEEVLRNAFAQWDDEKSGMINEEKIRNDLMKKGEKFTAAEVELSLHDAPIYTKGGQNLIDYIEFTKLICGTKKDDE